MSTHLRRENFPVTEREQLDKFIAEMEAQFALSTGTAGAARTTITRKTAKTVLASLEQIATLPWANKQVDAANMHEILGRMNEAGMKQWQAAWDAAFQPQRVCDYEESDHIPVSNGIPASATAKLIALGLVEEVSDEKLRTQPTTGAGTGFFRIEEKLDENGNIYTRVRFLFWTKRQNEALKSSSSSFKIDVHMHAPAQYVSAIEEEAVTTGDISSGFSHIEIPKSRRHLFRMQDADGNIVQLTRLPMGLVPSCQLMEVITLALIGSPIVCKPQFVQKFVRLDGYVDDFRCAGSRARVRRWAAQVERNAAAMRITIKNKLVVSTTATYLGVCYDHEKKTVHISDKTLSKLPDSFGTSCTAGMLQRSVARLIFCSGPLDINLGRFYFTMKHVTRMCNKMNSGAIDDETSVGVPSALRNSLNNWLRLARQPRTVAAQQQQRKRRTATLYTDASLYGWGGFFISSNGTVHIVGGKWRDAQQLVSSQISWLEARAVRYSFEALRELVTEHEHIELRIDNTSVMTAMQRGRGKAVAIHVEVIETIEWLRVHNISVDSRYIESSRNPADAVSRGEHQQQQH